MKKTISFILTLTFVLAALICPAQAEDIKLGVTGAFYDDLWAPAVEALKAEDIHVELVQFSDFALPNNALNGGDIEMNAFQHHAYFNNDTTTNDYDLKVIADTFVITMNLYSAQYETIDALKEAADAGKKPTIAVPNDATNFGRALLVLQEAGLLTLGEYEGTPLEENIEESKVELYLVNASMTYQYLADVDAAIINGNYAASYGVDPASAIFYETVDLTNESFICVIAVRAEDAENETYQRVAEVFCSDVTKEVMDTTFKGFFQIAWDAEATQE